MKTNKEMTMAKKMVLIIALMVMVSAVPSDAAEMTSLYRGVRPLGMGDAFTALANDENAVFYNPAGLGHVDEWRVNILNPKMEIGQSTLDFYSDASNLKSGDTVGATNLLRKYVGKHLYANVSVYPNFTKKNFSVGGFGGGSLNAEVNTPTYPTMTADMSMTGGATLGLARQWMEDRVSLGVSAKYLVRQRAIKTFTPIDFASSNTSYDFSKNAVNGSGVGIDLGGVYSFPNMPDWKPRVGAALQNIGDVDFGKVTNAGKNVDNKAFMSLNVGGAVTRKLWIMDTTFAADYRDLANNTSNDSDMAKRLHLGVEAKFPRLLSLRAGINQGYPSFGVGISLWLVKFDYAYYSEEVGAYAGQREDARHVAQLSIGF